VRAHGRSRSPRSPASASRAASKPPMAPAPTTQIRICFGGAFQKVRTRQYLVEGVAQAADAVDDDVDDCCAPPIGPAPSEVPQEMTSPGISVMSRETMATSLAGGKNMSLTG
jgi:hypothetical protein